MILISTSSGRFSQFGDGNQTRGGPLPPHLERGMGEVWEADRETAN